MFKNLKKDKVVIVGEDKIDTPINNGIPSEMHQVDVPTPQAQVQGAPKIKKAEKNKPEEKSITPKPKELEAIQALVNLPESGTPSSQILQRCRAQMQHHCNSQCRVLAHLR